MRNRELDRVHQHILTRVELALGRRTWSWLAREAGIPQSTLATQAGKPRFSIGVLVSVARALEKDISYFLPPIDIPVDEASEDVGDKRESG